MKYFTIKIIAISIIISLAACKDFIVIDIPKDRITTPAVFTDDATAAAAVSGLYARLGWPSGTPFLNGAVTIFLGLYTDEFDYTGTNSNDREFAENNLSIRNDHIYLNLWKQAYEIIYISNRCIEGLQASDRLDPSLKSQLLGECHFIRAFCYWYLVNLFGDVPLTKITTYEDNSLLPRTVAKDVLTQVKNDLVTAQSLLVPEYPSAGKFRVNYYTATALLARYYLYNREWQLAEKTATEIINSPLYNFEPDLLKIFLTTSTEAIWQLGVDQGTINVFETQRFIPIGTVNKPMYPVTEGLIQAFEPGDSRAADWLSPKTVAGIDYIMPYKYKVRANAVKTESLIMFRITEMYMIRAEAIAMQDNRDLDDALLDLNRIRNRSDLPSIVSADRSFVRDAILKERRVEFFAEWGNRFFDLKRLGKLDQVLSSKTGWNTEDQYLPIPYQERLANPLLTQNDGY